MTLVFIAGWLTGAVTALVGVFIYGLRLIKNKHTISL